MYRRSFAALTLVIGVYLGHHTIHGEETVLYVIAN